MKSAIDTLIWQAIELYPVDVLPQFLSDGSDRVRIAAARAIQLEGGAAEFSLATSMLKSRKPIDRELGAFILGQLAAPELPYRKPSIPILEGLLMTDTAARVRSAAAAALGHLRAREAIDTLVAAAKDAFPEVRASVASALARFPRNKKARGCLGRLARDPDEIVRYWATD